MKKINKKSVQISLIFLGLILIAVTYFIYPKINQKTEVEIQAENMPKSTEDTEGSSFTNVEYNGFTTEGSPYVIRSETANTMPDDPDTVYMQFITAKFYYKNGRVVIITSDLGEFNKINGDIRFKKNIKMTDSDDNKLTSENLDMLVSENYASAYNNVELKTPDGHFVIADKILFDGEKKSFKISMFDTNKNVKVKLID